MAKEILLQKFTLSLADRIKKKEEKKYSLYFIVWELKDNIL